MSAILLTKGQWYLASPYTHKDPMVMEQRYEEALNATAHLIKEGQWTYSPIVHCHEMAKRHAFPTHVEFWKIYNHSFILASLGLVVLQIEGWKDSNGVLDEIDYAMGLGLPVNTLVPLGLGKYACGSM